MDQHSATPHCTNTQTGELNHYFMQRLGTNLLQHLIRLTASQQFCSLSNECASNPMGRHQRSESITYFIYHNSPSFNFCCRSSPNTYQVICWHNLQFYVPEWLTDKWKIQALRLYQCFMNSDNTHRFTSEVTPSPTNRRLLS